MHAPQPVQARGADRAAAIVVGKHGIQVVRGQQQGLFLPSVAIEQQWDSERFLDQVCLKAGMYATAWRDDATALYTFEGEMLRTSLADSPAAPRRECVCRSEHLPGYTELCSNNVNAILSGSTPSYFSFQLPDGDVSGVVLTLGGLRTPDGGDAIHFSQISLRSGVPLQSTLFALCQAAAQTLARQRPTAETLAAVRLGVAILHDAAMHGTVQDADLAGVDPKERAL